MSCTSGCRTKDHESYAACLRAKSPRVSWSNSANNMDLTAEKRWNAEVQGYYDAAAQGIQPDGTTKAAVEKAVRISNETGVAYQGA